MEPAVAAAFFLRRRLGGAETETPSQRLQQVLLQVLLQWLLRLLVRLVASPPRL